MTDQTMSLLTRAGQNAHTAGFARWSGWPTAGATALKFARRCSDMSTKEAAKMRSVPESKVSGNLIEGHICQRKPFFGLGKNALADKTSNRNTRNSHDVVIEPPAREIQFGGIEVDRRPFAEIFLD
jgi:hypothetical protein